MRRLVIVLACVIGLALVYGVAHLALIEVGREVVVLRTVGADGAWLERRLWVVDHAGTPWLHGGDSGWMHNLKAHPIVELERAGETRRYRAEVVPKAHPRIDALLREKYGIADRWVRFVAPCSEAAAPVRLTPLSAAPHEAP